MAIAAIDAQPGDVMLMAERDRLGPRHLGVSYVGRPLQLEHRPQQRRDQEYRPVNRGAGDCVRTAMKNLHRSELSVQPGRHTQSLIVCCGLFALGGHRHPLILFTKTGDYNSSHRFVIVRAIQFLRNFSVPQKAGHGFG